MKAEGIDSINTKPLKTENESVISFPSLSSDFFTTHLSTLANVEILV
jgi:hypothetical protein